MFELYWKIREHYVTAVRGRERNSYVVCLVATAILLVLAIALLICAISHAPTRVLVLISGFELVAAAAANIADLVEKWYYGPEHLRFRIFHTCFTGFMAIMLFVLACIM